MGRHSSVSAGETSGRVTALGTVLDWAGLFQSEALSFLVVQVEAVSADLTGGQALAQIAVVDRGSAGLADGEARLLVCGEVEVSSAGLADVGGAALGAHVQVAEDAGVVVGSDVESGASLALLARIAGFALEADVGQVADIVFAPTDAAVRNAGFSVGVEVVAFCAGVAGRSLVTVHAQRTMVRSVAAASHAVVFPDIALHDARRVDSVPPFGAGVALVARVAGHAIRTVVWSVAGTGSAVNELNVAVHDAGARSVIVVSAGAAQTVGARVSSGALGAGSWSRTSADAVVAVRQADVANRVVARHALASGAFVRSGALARIAVGVANDEALGRISSSDTIAWVFVAGIAGAAVVVVGVGPADCARAAGISGSVAFASGADSRVGHGAAVNAAGAPVQVGDTSRFAGAILVVVVAVAGVALWAFPAERTVVADAKLVAVAIAVGRALYPADRGATRGEQFVAIVAHAAWTSEFQADVARLAANTLASA